jgi:protease PrsW
VQAMPTASRRFMVVLYVVPLVGGLGALTWGVVKFGLSTQMHLDAVVAALLPGGAFVALLMYANRHLRLAWAHVLALVGWGFLTVSAYAMTTAGTADLLLMSAFGISEDKAWRIARVVVSPMVEETAKALGVLWAFAFLPRRSGPVAGFFYASLIGVGFAMCENITYYNRGVSWHLLAVRLPGNLMHPVFTSCFAVLLGLVWAGRTRWLPPVMGVLGWLLAVALHGMSNTVVSNSDVDVSGVFGAVLWLGVLVVMSRLNPKQVGAEPLAQD